MRNRKKVTPSESESPMVEVIPCYGGPKDGSFFSLEKAPLGYKAFDVRKRKVYLWNQIKIERLDFQTLARASRMNAEDDPHNSFGEGL